MNTTLPKRSLFTKNRIDEIVKEIVNCQKDRTAMIILFGSYARGDWVSDEYMEGGITYSYQSDIDLLIVLRNGGYAGYGAIKIERKIKQILEDKGLINPKLKKEPWISLIFESIGTVNRNLEKGQYFFSDIKSEGVLLYDNGEFELADRRELSGKEMGEIAKEEYEYWYGSGVP